MTAKYSVTVHLEFIGTRTFTGASAQQEAQQWVYSHRSKRGTEEAEEIPEGISPKDWGPYLRIFPTLSNELRLKGAGTIASLRVRMKLPPSSIASCLKVAQLRGEVQSYNKPNPLGGLITLWEMVVPPKN